MAHLLLVEDEQRLSKLMKRVLEDEGHVVDLAADGDDGLSLAVGGTFDAIVLDVLLPRMDGFEVCRTLRGRGITTPVLMLTARGSLEDRVTGLDAGADDYLTKPFAFEELLARVRALTRRQPAIAAGGLLQLADLSMDPTKHEVRRGDRLINLTGKEYQLLEYLLRHPNQVLTRAQILDNVWGYDAEPGASVIEIYIHYLRTKIDRSAPSPLLHTVRGVGYVLREGAPT
jgi:DNA-binding response OmpR family regulator